MTHSRDRHFRTLRLQRAIRLPLLLVGMLCLLPTAADAAYRVDLNAPEILKDLLSEHLDLLRYRDRDDIDPDQLNFMIATVGDQVRSLASTEGYFATKTQVRVEGEADARTIRLDVEAGPQTVVSEVDVAVQGVAVQQSPQQVAEIRQTWGLPAGAPFRQEEWSAAKQEGLRILQRRRYAAARIADSSARIFAGKNSAELGVTYDSGPVFTFGAPRISGTRRYPDQIVHNMNPIETGDEYSTERLLEFQRQVLKTPYFSNVVIDVERDPEKAKLVPITVNVTEFPVQRVRAGVGYTTDTGTLLEGLYSHFNVFDRAMVFEAQAVVEEERRFGSLQLALPPRAGGWVHDVHSSFERTTLEGLDLRSSRLGVRRARSASRRDTAYTLEYYNDELQQLSGATVPADIVVEPGRHQALVAGFARTRRETDDALFPRRGQIVLLETGLAVKGVLTDQTFFRVYSRARKYVPALERDIVILRAELGAVFTKGGNASIPASLLFRAGGTESVRGYPFRSIGNERGGTVYPTRYLATGGVEYIRRLTDTWGAAVFYDVGLATDRWSDRSLFHALGIGARWRSPVGRVNVDLAYGFRANKIRPHLSLGIAF